MSFKLFVLTLIFSLPGYSFFNKEDLQSIKNHTGKLVIQLDKKLGLNFKEPTNGKVYSEGIDVANCSGVVISKKHILTAAHCTEFFTSSEVLRNTYFEISAHENAEIKTQRFYLKSFKNSHAYAKYNQLSNSNIFLKFLFKDQLIKNDLAILEVQTELPYQAEFSFNLTADNPAPLLSFSFTNGMSAQTYGTFKMCDLRDNKKIIRTTCAQEITKGNSGGPLFNKVDGKINLVGITSTRIQALWGKEFSYYFAKPSLQLIELSEPSYLSQKPLRL